MQVRSTEQLLDLLVGAARFELATTCTPCRYATRLRYAPTREKYIRAGRQFASFQRNSSMTFRSSCLSAARATLRVSCARGAEGDGLAERADAALRLSSRRLRAPLRSEERRVGKECRLRGWAGH